MIKKVLSSSSKYGKYFLAMEAPEDETPGASVTQTTETPDDDYSDLNSDFTDIGEDDDELLGNDEDVEPITDFNDVGEDDDLDTPEADEEEVPDDGNIENSQETDTEAPEEPQSDFNDAGKEVDEEPPAEDASNESDAPDAEPVGDTTTEEPNDTEPPADGGETESAPEDENTPAQEGEDTGDGGDGETQDTPDFNDTGEESDTPAEGDAPPDDTQAGQENGQKGPGLEYDSTRKYNLFKEFMSLYNATDNYISKLESNVKDDPTTNQVIKIATNNLREIRDLTYDYMLIKFEVSSYVQSLVFYQKMVVAVQLVFKLIQNLNKNASK